MVKIAIAGYFGWGNFGDQLFLDTVLKNQKLLWPESTSVMCLTEAPLSPHSTRRVVGGLTRLRYTMDAALRADVLAYCGGSVFTKISGADAIRRRIRPPRVQALGVSVGPFKTDQAEREVAAYLARFEKIVYRDGSWKGYSWANLHGNHQRGGDIAALSPHIEQVVNTERNGLVVCPSAAAGLDGSALAEQARRAHEALASGGGTAPVKILALNGHPKLGDERLSREVARMLENSGIQSEVVDFMTVGIGGACRILSRAELVLSQRLHGAIVSYLSGGRFLIADHHPKCKAFVQEIGGDASICLRPEEDDIASGLDSALGTGDPWKVSPDEYIRRAREVYFS